MSVRVLSVFGTRPEAIKMAPVVRRLHRDARFESRVCVTGQHRQMLDSALALFDIRPDHDLGVMAPGQDLFDVTGKVLLGLRDVLRSERPDVVLVHGDTTTCLAATLAAFYAEVPVGHVEAGLRSGDLRAPFPEEANRMVADRLAELCFAPTAGARRNLLQEGADPARVHVTGNTVIDALREVAGRVAARPARDFEASFGPLLAQLAEDWPGRSVLVTGHRRESFGGGFRELCGAIREAAGRHPDWLFVYPVHLNPNVQRPVHEILRGVANVVLVEPLDYEPFVWLMRRSDLILTDSGGIQEEGPALGKPVLVMRDVTERPEAVEAGTVRLVGTDRARIVRGLEEILLDPALYETMARAHNPYGDGRASERIAEALAGRFAKEDRELCAVA
ncbi:MAG TPA: UDP-N-acetylglucosamine 2-epimerase (non-hydrolyzing) [Planctomycetota bacterium]|nr:UDP-N-acetylglucosamine 2-epimerase (non-hydrolyzing) [Planctomycetota bacterium]